MNGARANATQWSGRSGLTPIAEPDAIRTAVARTLRTATAELSLLLGCTLDERRLAPLPLLAEAVDRGVRVRILHELGVGAAAQHLARTGAQVRAAGRLPSRLLIADRRVALILPPAGAADPGPAIATGRSPLLATLVEHFELQWSVTPVSGPPPGSLGPRDAEILGLLASGLTDDAVAARVGSSARTIRRRVAALMREAAASTRFQAGVEAVRRGWL